MDISLICQRALACVQIFGFKFYSNRLMPKSRPQSVLFELVASRKLKELWKTFSLNLSDAKTLTPLGMVLPYIGFADPDISSCSH